MSLLAAIFLIGLLIFIHELGHLLAARAVGIPVARFSIGFGPVLWSWRRGGVEYCVSLVPLGGYVMPECDDEEKFFRIPIWRRIVLWIGGPLANFVAAGLLMATINCLTDGVTFFGLVIEPPLQVVRLTTRFLATLPSIFMHPRSSRALWASSRSVSRWSVTVGCRRCGSRCCST